MRTDDLERKAFLLLLAGVSVAASCGR